MACFLRGEIYRLSAHYYNRDLRKRVIANFYAYHNSETQLLLCFTEEKTDAIEQTLGQVADTSTGICYMFISPNIFDEVRSQIINEFPTAHCFYFSAKHIAKFARKGETRPSINRTIVYHGEDALQTLDEVSNTTAPVPEL